MKKTIALILMFILLVSCCFTAYAETNSKIGKQFIVTDDSTAADDKNDIVTNDSSDGKTERSFRDIPMGSTYEEVVNLLKKENITLKESAINEQVKNQAYTTFFYKYYDKPVNVGGYDVAVVLSFAYVNDGKTVDFDQNNGILYAGTYYFISNELTDEYCQDIKLPARSSYECMDIAEAFVKKLNSIYGEGSEDNYDGETHLRNGGKGRLLEYLTKWYNNDIRITSTETYRFDGYYDYHIYYYDSTFADIGYESQHILDRQAEDANLKDTSGL